MSRDPLVFRIPGHLWDELKLDDAERYYRALCALYMHRGPHYIRDLVRREADDFEVRELLRVAPSLGLTKEDRLERKQDT